MKSVATAVLVVLITSLFLLLFPVYSLVTLVISLLINIAVIKLMFMTSWRKSLVTWVFSLIANGLVLGILLLISIYL